jgi:L-threonylcarbamoyladenylate synthase
VRRSVDRWNPQKKIIAEAARALVRGELVAFPTETVYGLGANGLDAEAVRAIYRAKGRPSDNPLILHLANPGEAESVAFVDDRARRLINLFWPGPLTLVLPARTGVVPPVTRGGLETVALRMPSHPVALALIEATALPVAAPSANRSGRPSPTDADAVEEDLGESLAYLLDGGPTDVGVESTVVDATGKDLLLLRPGALPLEVIAEAEGQVGLAQAGEGRRSPGTRYRHYAPDVPLLIWDGPLHWEALPGPVGYMGMADPPRPAGESVLFRTVDDYGRGLFSALRHLERAGVAVIVAQWPPQEGIGLALRDRLLRASGEG